MELPSWWGQVPTDRPWIYVNLGSSGDRAALGTVLEGLASLPVAVVAATAGYPQPARLPANVWLADYLPGDRVAEKASVVVCNGGSPTAMQALSAGVPIVGIPSNLDQYANMAHMERAGVGFLLPAGTLTPQCVRRGVERCWTPMRPVGNGPSGRPAASTAIGPRKFLRLWSARPCQRCRPHRTGRPILMERPCCSRRAGR